MERHERSGHVKLQEWAGEIIVVSENLEILPVEGHLDRSEHNHFVLELPFNCESNCTLEIYSESCTFDRLSREVLPAPY